MNERRHRVVALRGLSTAWPGWTGGFPGFSRMTETTAAEEFPGLRLAVAPANLLGSVCRLVQIDGNAVIARTY